MPKASPPSSASQSWEAEVFWHSLTEDDLFHRLDSSPAGLSASEVAARLREFGRNELATVKGPSLPVIFLHQFKSPLIYVLLAAAFIALAMGDTTDAAFILFVVLLNAALGAYQEWKAEKHAAALQRLFKVQAHVRRQGGYSTIDAAELVPGDIVQLESGLRVPADLRLLSTQGVRIDEALLTGESVSVAKRSGIEEPATSLADRSNMAFAGTLVESGRALGVVVATGARTEVGKINRNVSETKQSQPPLLVRMDQFARQVSYAVVAACLLLGTIAYLQGTPLREVFFLSVALAVSAIPEGLPVAITVALSIATSRMAKRNVIVRRLAAVEGLGSCTYIASDKTGTLTVNRQSVQQAWLHGQAWIHGPLASEAELARWSVLASEGEAQSTPTGWTFEGDAVDVACWEWAARLGLEIAALRDVRRLDSIPYESENAYAVTFFEEHGERHAAMKGAPEVVLGFCGTSLEGEGANQDIAAAMSQLTGAGMRVLAVAGARHLGNDTNSQSSLPSSTLPRFELFGLLGLIDPPRPEAREAVERCRAAGITVAMVTGDHPLTALAIAQQVGIDAKASNVVTGKELAEIGSPDAPLFLETVDRSRVFARVTPLQKLQIVESLGRLGHFVAVTGDGINDAPALKKAHVGVAMGSGTDVAKETASILVTDDNFASIQAGVEEGRFAYDNIRKVTYLLIATGTAEIILFALSALAQLPIPLLPVQLLWLNLVTNGIQDVALAFEAGESASTRRPPRPPSEGMFNRLMIEQTLVAGISAALIAFLNYELLINVLNLSPEEARTRLLLLMVWIENFHVFNSRSEYVSAFRIPLRRNWILIGGIVAAQLINILAMVTPLGQKVLRVTPITVMEWLVPCLMASLVLVALEIYKVVKHGRTVAWTKLD